MTSPEEATRLCISALRNDQAGDRGYDELRHLQTEELAHRLREGELRIVSADLLRTLQKAGVLIGIESDEGRRYEATSFCHHLIDKVASGEEVLVAARDHFVESIEGDSSADRTWKQECESLLPRLAALEKVAEAVRAAIHPPRMGGDDYMDSMAYAKRPDLTPTRQALAELDALDKEKV